jgi:hypothetical protein
MSKLKVLKIRLIEIIRITDVIMVLVFLVKNHCTNFGKMVLLPKFGSKPWFEHIHSFCGGINKFTEQSGKNKTIFMESVNIFYSEIQRQMLKPTPDWF